MPAPRAVASAHLFSGFENPGSGTPRPDAPNLPGKTFLLANKEKVPGSRCVFELRVAAFVSSPQNDTDIGMAFAWIAMCEARDIREAHHRREIFMNQHQGEQKAKGNQKDEHKDQQNRHSMQGGRKDDQGRQGTQGGQNDQGRQRQGGMGDEQDEELKRPVKAGQGDYRGQDDRQRQGGPSGEKEEAGRSRQSEPRR